MAVIYLCPSEKYTLCCWEGQASDIKQHFEEEHGDLLLRTNSVEVNLEELPQNKLLHLEGELYLMQNNLVEKGRLDVKLRYLGSNDSASKLQYDVIVTANKISYKYDPSRYFSCVLPKLGGWDINIDCLEKFHGKLQTITCTILLEDTTLTVSRKVSEISLKINNSFVEKNFCDETEAYYLDAISLIDSKLENLKKQKEDDEEDEEFDFKRKNRDSDYMDKISQLNFSLLENSFSAAYEEYQNESETMPNIPEEVNLSCSTCGLDMLPPIYLCSNGHNVCSWCKSKACKKCNFAITDNRNTELENISRTHMHQCRYYPEGCNEKFNYTEIRAHEAKCHFCKYKCMTDDCPHEGKFDHFINHLKIVHSSIKIIHSTKNNDFPKNTEMYIVNKSIGIFYCTSEINNDFIIWRVIFCGPKERQFFCELTFKGSKYKDAIFLKRRDHIYEIRKPITELKKNKAKDKYAQLTIVSFDN